MTHDYTHKGGIVHTEIMLPAHAPPEFSDRSTLWNSVEQLALVRAFVKDNFVDAGMCADFAIHDKGTGNPHAHILLTIRPLRPDRKWGPKCRKVYDLDSQGHRIPDGKGGWKNHREDTTDWNNRENAEKWRAAWAAYANRALEAAGRPERIDHRSYKRQGVEKIPSIHIGPAASQMERRGIATEKGNINREIAADNKLLKEIKARITRLYNWSKEQAESATPAQGKESIVAKLYRSNKPLIVTTNMKLDELKHPPDLAHARIYDRILECCAPILFAGKNFREDNAASTKAAARCIVSADHSKI